MINILWLIVILLAVVSQWYIIEKRKKVPNKLLWLGIRGLVFGGFLWWAVSQGYMIYWAAVYMITTFAFLFPLGLNLMRGKDPAYLSPSGSVYDKIMLKIFRHQQIVFWFLFILCLAGIGIMYFYGKCTLNEINDFRLRVNCG